MTTTEIMQSCADYHRARAKQHDGLAAASAGDSREHHLHRAALHESWRVAVEAAMIEQRMKT